MQNTYKKNYIGRSLIIIIGLAIVLAVSLFCAHNIKKDAEAELWANIEDVAKDNTVNIENQINAKYCLLKALAMEVEAGDEGMDITQYHSFVESYNLRRLGFCDESGMCYATDGDVTDLSFREFFKRAMEGKNTISGILFDAMNDDRAHLNIMTVPTYDKLGNPNGLVGITYKTEDFNDSLRMVIFDRQGGCFAVNEHKEIVVAKGNVPYQLTDYMLGSSIGLEDERGIMSRGGEDYFYVATKTWLLDGDAEWTVYTLVPTEVLNARMGSTRRNLILLNIFLVATVVAGVIIYLLLTRNQRITLQTLAYEDPLTKGPNLAAFMQKLSDRRNHEGAFILMDIRNFSSVNITLGQEQGDGIIRACWHIIRQSLGENDTAARVKDDNFIIYYADPDKSRAVVRMRKVSNDIITMTTSKKLSGIHPSFGIYISSEADPVEEAYHKSIVASNIAKSNNGADLVFYDEIDHDRLRANELLEARFEDALNDREFEVWYQPKYCASDERLVGAEALIRWRDKDGKMIMPGLFIPLFESDGKIAALDEFVFREVCTQIKRWCTKGRRVVPISVNLSRASLFHSDVLAKYLTILVQTDVDPHLIQLEITESAMNGRNNVREILEKLRDNGIKILMDDFGTGYSALSTLNSGCFDVLKVDKSLVDDIGTDRGETLLHCVIDMGHQLGLSITAEGVEEKVQLEYLRQEGCDDIQGYYFSKPLPMEEFEKILG